MFSCTWKEYSAVFSKAWRDKPMHNSNVLVCSQLCLGCLVIIALCVVLVVGGFGEHKALLVVTETIGG